MTGERRGAEGLAARISLTLPRHARTIAYVRGLTRNAMELVGASPESIGDTCVVVGEACANAVEHAGGGEHFDVTLDVTPRRLVVIVSDQGRGAPDEALHAAMPEPTALRGRGLPLIRALSDEATVTSRFDAGTTVQIIKNLASS